MFPPIDVTLLSCIDLAQAHQQDSSSQLALVGHKIVWLSSKEIEQLRKDHPITSLNTIVQSLNILELARFNLWKLQKIVKNLEWINGQIDKQNSKINSHVLFFTFNHFAHYLGASRLEQEKVKEEDLKILREDLQSKQYNLQILLQKPFKDLKRILNKDPTKIQDLMDYFLYDPQQCEEKIEQAKYLFPYFCQRFVCDVKLSQLLQEHPAFQELLLKYFEKNQQDLQKHPSVEYVLKALTHFRKIPSSLHKEENFLYMLIFIEENDSKILSGDIGVPTHDPEIKKIQFDQEMVYSIFYHTKTKKISHIQCFLDEGKFKVVKKRLDWITLQLKAVSTQKLATPMQKRLAEKEVEMMQRCQGLSHVVQLESTTSYFSKSEQEVRLNIMPFYNMHTLEQSTTSYSEQDKLCVARGLIKGVLQLHHKGIIHRDLKPANIFLEKVASDKGKQKIRAIVGDLGLSCWKENDPDREDLRGTFFYMSPEVLNGEEADVEHDAWGVGMILCQLFYHQTLYEKWGLVVKNKQDLKQAIKELKQVPEPVHKQSIDFVIWKLTRPHPSERMTLEEALQMIKQMN